MPNILEISGTVNVAEIKAGLDSAAAGVTGATGEMSDAFKALAAESQVATAQISGAWLEAASSSIALVRAKDEVRAASRAAKAAEDDDTAALIRLAEAQEAAALAAETAAAAQRALATTTAEAAVETESSMALMSESFLEMAESAKLSSLTAISSFSALGAILGGGIVVGIIAETANKFKEQEIEIGHLSEATGIEIDRLAELQAAMTEVGSPTDRLGITLQRLSKAIVEAADGSPKAVSAFDRLGVSTDGWAEKMPNAMDVLMQLSDHFHESENATNDLGSATAVLGRNVISLVGFLKQGSEAIEEQMSGYQSLGSATKEAQSSAAQLQATEAKLGADFKEMAANIFPAVAVGAQIFTAAMYALALPLNIAADIIIGLVGENIALGESFIGVSHALMGDFKGGIEWLTRAGEQAKSSWHGMVDGIVKDTQNAGAAIAKLFATPIKVEHHGDEETDGKQAESSRKAREAELSAAAAHAVAMVNIRKAEVETESKLGQITDSEKLARLQALAAEEIRIQEDLATKKLALARADADAKPEEITNLLAQRQALADKLTALSVKSAGDIAVAEKKSLDDQLKSAQTLFQEMENLRLKDVADASKAEQKKGEDASAADDLILAGEIAHAKAGAGLEKEKSDADFKANQITQAQHEAMLRDIENQEFTFQQRILNEKLAAVAAYGEKEKQERQRILNEIQALEDSHALALQKIEDQSVKQIDKSWKSLMNDMARDFKSTVVSIAQGHETLLQGFSNMVSRMLGQWIAFELERLIRHLAGTEAIQGAEESLKSILVALHLMTAGETKAVDAASGSGEITKAAAVGAANAWAATAAIPIVGPELAPGVAAATMASIMGFIPLTFAERGALVPGDMPIFAHAGEMILPKNISSGLQGMIQQRGDSGGSNGGGGEHTHVHFHGELIDQRFFDNHKSEIASVVKSARRTGHLN